VRREAVDDQSRDSSGPAAIPPDVAARLDTVLEELLAPRVEAASPRDDLAVRRRRWPQLLVAAAALCVIGLAGGAVSTHGFGLGGGTRQVATSDSAHSTGATPSKGAGTTAGSNAPRVVGPSDTGSGASPSGAGPAAPDTGSGPSAGRSMAVAAAGPPLRRTTLSRDVQRLVDRTRPLPAGLPPGSTCLPPPLHAGERLLAVRLDGRRSTMVLGRPEDGRLEARVYSCADPKDPVVTTTVRAPAH
jgi:hypothetical protein